jgi:hypothetical protein
MNNIESVFQNIPHVVILGAGASIATIPNGDKKGKKISCMDNFIENLGMTDIISSVNLKTTSKNLEDIYSELHAGGSKYKDIRIDLENKIRSYFNNFIIPDNPIIYDFLLLSLRKKDLVATFNWDPLLLQSYNRIRKITSDIPKLEFLHGNVGVGYCEKDNRVGNIENVCSVCKKSFKKTDLLYPIKKKNYNSDYFTKNSWLHLKEYLKKAYIVTVFGYGAPKTDVEAISLMQEAYGKNLGRDLENFDIIDIKSRDELEENWRSFIHTHHSHIYDDFFKSNIAQYPRRTTEQLAHSTLGCKFTSPKFPVNKNMDFNQLKEIMTKLTEEEQEAEKTNQPLRL